MSVDPETQATGMSSATARRWIPLSEITEPGAYVAKQTGDLIRISADGASSGDEELLEQNADQSLVVAMLSGDPFIPITKARFAAAAMDIEISF